MWRADTLGVVRGSLLAGRLLVLPAAVGAAVYFAWLPIEPDTSYFVGGLSLFPSPIGTLLGTAGGYPGLDVLNAASTAGILILVALIARELGRQPLIAQSLAILLVGGRWFQNSTMDAFGVMLLLTGAVLYLRGRSTLAVAFGCVAAATHLATLPLAVGAMLAHGSRRRTVWIVGALLAGGAALALVTRYRAGFAVLTHPEALVEGARELMLACWPLLLLVPIGTLHPRVRRLVIGSAFGAMVAGAIPASIGQTNLTRYAIPCMFLPAAALRLRRPFGVAWQKWTRPRKPTRAYGAETTS